MEECTSISILLVDREPAFRVAFAGMLREDGHRVLEYSDVGEVPAFEVLGWVDVLIAAHEMPVQNGLWLADRFHDALPRAPIVLLAAYRPFILDREEEERPFLHLVEKPLRYEALHELVHDLVSTARGAP